jgi:hypothetical protein
MVALSQRHKRDRRPFGPPVLVYRLRRFVKPRLGDLLAADVRLFFQNMIDGANVDYVSRRNLMLILAAEMSQPDIDSLLEGKLRQSETPL